MKTTSTKNQKWRQTKKNEKNEDDLKTKWKKMKTTSKHLKKKIGCDIIVI